MLSALICAKLKTDRYVGVIKNLRKWHSLSDITMIVQAIIRYERKVMPHGRKFSTYKVDVQVSDCFYTCFTPKYRRKTIYYKLREDIKGIINLQKLFSIFQYFQENILF